MNREGHESYEGASLCGLGFAASAAPNMVERDRSGAKKDESEGNGSEGERKFVSTILREEAVFPMHFCNRHAQIDQDGETGAAGKQSKDHKNASEKLRSSGEVSHPARQSEAAHHLNVMRQTPEYFGISVANHDGA